MSKKRNFISLKEKKEFYQENNITKNIKKSVHWKIYFLILFIFGFIWIVWHIFSMIKYFKFCEYKIIKSLPMMFYKTNKYQTIISLNLINKTIFTTTNNKMSNINYNSFKYNNNNWTINIYNDIKMRNSLYNIYKYNRKNIKLIKNTKYPVELSDLWRYSIINKYGGLYTDTDVYLLQPIDLWFYIYDYTLNNIPINLLSKYQSIKHYNNIDISMIIGIEELNSYHGNPMQFVQWCFVSKKNNPLLTYIINSVLNSMKKYSNTQINIQKRTGPIIWTKSILNYIATHTIDLNGIKNDGYPNALLNRNELNKRGQLIKLYPYNKDNLNYYFYLVILPFRAFNQCRVGCNVKDIKNEHEILIKHQFKGSWKNAINTIFEQ